jgi:diguanylate cyclase (GGDEF)-like protein
MKRLIPTIAVVLGGALAALAAPPDALTSLRAIHALSNAQASAKLPVAFEATITYARVYEKNMYVQDGDAAIFVVCPPDIKVIPGDRVLVRGTTQESFNPIVLADSVTVLRHGALPKPIATNFDELIHRRYDAMFVTVRAKVRAADMAPSPAAPVQNIRLQLVTEGGHMDAAVDSDDQSVLESLLGSEVEFTGAESGNFDDKMQLIGLTLHAQSLEYVKVLNSAASPWSLPITPLDQVLSSYHVDDLTERVRVHGTITYFEPGSAIVLQDGNKSLWINTNSRGPFQIGDVADVTGFPNTHEFLSTLNDGEVRDSGARAAIAPVPATWHQLAYWDVNKPVGHQFDLVSIEGQVVTEVQDTAQDDFVLTTGGKLFTATFHHRLFETGQRLPIAQVPLGSKVRVTGICMTEDSDPLNKGREVPFNILLRSFNDIAVVGNPSPLSIRNLASTIILLLLAVIALGAWGLIQMRKVHRQTAASANLERRRARILEDINGIRPLAEIIEEITAMASFLLGGAPCWCQIADGARLGNCPRDAEKLRIVREGIPARSGPPLGMIFAGFDPATKGSSREAESLSMAAGLAALAIEARRLYSDLLHRSEFDLLTDIHNRFSLEKILDAQIEEAREKAGIFGLIYIDLDGFKQVNDAYGHHIGDLYLQEVARRMKQQLRTHDVLARLGGDEFAALVSVARSRAGVEEIALRLERCFDAPFEVEGCQLHGAASLGIALYPEDGADKDSLLSAADTAMYMAKNSRRQMEKTLAQNPQAGLSQ